VHEIVGFLDMLGMVVFAISGALAAAERRLDILGFILFGTITGIGGGTIRDLLLQADEVFWFSDTRYLWVCILASVATWFVAHHLQSLRRVLLWADAIGLSVFSVIGAQKALIWEAPVLVAVGMGMMTASFGSLIRDSLLGQPPVLLEADIYVTAAALGALSYVGLTALAGLPGWDWVAGWAVPVSIGAAFLLRGSAILFNLQLPKYRPQH